MTEAGGERGGSEQVRDGKVCRDCDIFKLLGRWSGTGQCVERDFNPRAGRPACYLFRERKQPHSIDRSSCPEFKARES